MLYLARDTKTDKANEHNVYDSSVMLTLLCKIYIAYHFQESHTASLGSNYFLTF